MMVISTQPESGMPISNQLSATKWWEISKLLIVVIEFCFG